MRGIFRHIEFSKIRFTVPTALKTTLHDAALQLLDIVKVIYFRALLPFARAMRDEVLWLRDMAARLWLGLMAFLSPPKKAPLKGKAAATVRGSSAGGKRGVTLKERQKGEGQQESGEEDGGILFDQSETDFDPTELQGMPLPKFRKALKKGLKLASRLTQQSETYLRNFLPDPNLRTRVLEIAISRNGHPTLLLDKGEIVQYKITKGKLERVMTSPDMEAEIAVKYAMAGFLATGESINPKHVRFGRTPEFQARMKPIWVREYKKIMHEQKLAKPQAATPARSSKFNHAAGAKNTAQPGANPARTATAKAGPAVKQSVKQAQQHTLRLTVPRPAKAKVQEPTLS